MNKRHRVHLTATERRHLKSVTSTGRLSARALKRAQILLKADESSDGPGWSDEAISHALDVHLMTVAGVRKRYRERGLEAVLSGRYTGHNPAIVTGEVEAHLVALACQEPPDGREHWTMQLLADKLVELRVVERISDETVRLALKNELKPWLKQEWCIPPKANAAFVSQMEEVLDVYHGEYSLKYPLVCMDESNKQLLGEVRSTLPAEPGQPARYDTEYKRNGTQNLFLAFAPVQGWRDVAITEHRTKQDWAHYMKDLVDVHFPEAERITVVLDNLNTHTLASLYETFAPAEAHRLARKLELHYTPKHGSWLNMAEIEFSALSRQCLSRRVADAETLRRHVAAWVADRNAHGTTIQWRFTTADARTRLKHLYPVI